MDWIRETLEGEWKRRGKRGKEEEWRMQEGYVSRRSSEITRGQKYLVNGHAGDSSCLQ